jgi:hypothetical protein
MQIAFVVARLNALPLRHKLLACAISLAAATGCLALTPWLPHAYASSAWLAFDATAGAQAGGKSATALAESILSDDALGSVARQLNLFPKDSTNRQADRLRSHLAIASQPASKLRVTWSDAEPAQAKAVTDAVANLLASWVSPTSAGLEASDSDPLAPAKTATAAAASQSAPQTENAQTAQEIAQLSARHQTLLSEEGQLLAQLDVADHRLEELETEQHRLAGIVQQAKTERQAQITARQPLETKLVAAKKNLDDMRARYTEAYPDMQTAKDRIAELETQVAALPAVKPLPEADQARLDAVAKEIGQTRSERTPMLQRLEDDQTLDKTLRDRLEVLELPASPAAQGVAPTASQRPHGKHRRRVQSAGTVARARSASVGTKPPLAHTFRPGRSPFQILDHAGAAQPIEFMRSLLPWLALAAGLLTGILYLAFALWWFRVVQGVAALEKFVPDEVAYIGAIPRMVR